MKTRIAAVIVITLLFSASLALAGPGGRGMGGGGYGRGSGYGMTPYRGSNPNLTPEQSLKLRQMQETRLKEIDEQKSQLPAFGSGMGRGGGMGRGFGAGRGTGWGGGMNRQW